MKKILNNKLIIVLITIISTASISVYATIKYNAYEIIFTKEGRENVHTLEDALKDLYILNNDTSINAISNIELDSVTINNNIENKLYAILFSYTSNSNPSAVINSRVSINSITGAEAKEVFYKYNSSTHYGMRVYELSNCESTITINSVDSEILIIK